MKDFVVADPNANMIKQNQEPNPVCKWSYLSFFFSGHSPVANQLPQY